MGNDLSTTCRCNVGSSYLQIGDDDHEMSERSGMASLYCIGGHRPQGPVPLLLHVSVPCGPAWTSGLYRLVSGVQPNGMPLWKAVYADLWMYSMTNGKWGIGGRKEFEAGFQAGAAFVFCDSPHYGFMPNAVPSGWMHNKPAWTLDPSIAIEAWEEMYSVTLERTEPTDKYGLQCSVVEFEDEDEEDNPAGELLPDLPDLLANADRCGSRQPSSPSEKPASSALRLLGVAEGSLLALWNERMVAERRKSEVVAVDSDIVRVNNETDLLRMQVALLEEPRVEVQFSRPSSRPLRQAPSTEDEEEQQADQTEEAAKKKDEEIEKETKMSDMPAEGEVIEKDKEAQVKKLHSQSSQERSAGLGRASSRESTRFESSDESPVVVH